jgi:3-hydroxyisobutyrate dehydrogenase
MKIGFIGTGLMGKPMAKKLIENKFKVNVFNRTFQKAIELQKNGAEIFESVDLLINESDIIIFMLSDYLAINEVVSGIKVKNFSGKLFIQMGTLSPKENILLKKQFESANGMFIEAPVLGSIPQIIDRTLITFIGAETDLSEDLKKIFESFSKEILYVGKVGKASALKLAINQLIVSELSVFSMSLKYVINQGIDVEHFMNVLRKSALYAPTFDKKLNNFLLNDFSKPNFPLKHMLKDLKLIIDEFNEAEIETGILKEEKIRLENGLAKGYGEEDYSALYKCFNKE